MDRGDGPVDLFCRVQHLAADSWAPFVGGGVTLRGVALELHYFTLARQLREASCLAESIATNLHREGGKK